MYGFPGIARGLRHPVAGPLAGAALGWSAASGNLWAMIAALGLVGGWFQQHRMDKAKAAALEAAHQYGIDHRGDVCATGTPECQAGMNEAATEAGMAVIKGGSLDWLRRISTIGWTKPPVAPPDGAGMAPAPARPFAIPETISPGLAMLILAGLSVVVIAIVQGLGAHP